VDEVLPLIRDADRLAARLKRDWQAWNVPENWQTPFTAEWQVSSQGGRSYGLLAGRKPDFSRFNAYFIRDGEKFLLDWEATQGLGDAAFDTLQRGVGSGGVVRAFVTPENFYSLKFPESEFRSYKVLAPDREQVIWGYVKLGSPEAAALSQVFQTGVILDSANSEQPMTLRILPSPEGSLKNQWIIGEMLHIDWVSP
jgi:hypothetical protein